MARLGLTITDEMESLLAEESAKSHIPTSELVRMGIEEILKQRGYVLKESVVRGGIREGAGKKPRAAREKRAQDEE